MGAYFEYINIFSGVISCLDYLIGPFNKETE